MSIFFRHKGDFRRTEKYLQNIRKIDIPGILDKYGAKGAIKLAEATPKDSGEAASSWYHEVIKTDYGYKLSWNNSKMAGSIPLVILLQYGHGTRSGTFVQGRDFINPALLPVMIEISEALWKEVLNG